MIFTNVSQILRAEKKLLKKTKNMSIQPKTRTQQKQMQPSTPHARTINEIQQALTRKQTKKAMPDNPYIACRLDPFHAGNGQGIPDGTNQDYVVVDNLIYDDITCVTNNGFVIQTLPTLPAVASIIGGGAAGLNDINVQFNGGPSTVYKNPTSIYQGLLPLSVPLAYRNSNFLQGTALDDPYASVSARLVAVGYKLTYTGQSATCSGTVTVTPNNVAFTPAGISTSNLFPSGANGVSISKFDFNQGLASTSNPNTVLLSLDTTGTLTAYNKDSIVLRPEQGVFLLPRHRTRDFKINPTSDNVYGLTANTATAASGAGTTLVSYFCQPKNNNNTDVIWFDNDWTAYQITVSGIQAGSTFRWETAYCVEYVLPGASVFAPLTIKESPKDEAAISRVTAMLAKKPAASPAFV